MEGMKEVALALYEILPEEEKSIIQRDFNEMVTDKSVSEHFKSIFDEIRPENIDKVVETCKEYKEGNLDFKDFITLKYILKNRMVLICEGCSSLIMGRSFFSCYECFFSGEYSYDLCCGCYSSNKFKEHSHQQFYDNYTLLLQSRTIANMKTAQEKRNILEYMLIGCSSLLLDLAGDVKTQKVDYGDFDFNPKEKLGEISSRAKEMSDAADVSEKEEDKKFEENVDEVEISTWIPTPRGNVDLLGVAPSFETFGGK